jgi:hypothetical protein
MIEPVLLILDKNLNPKFHKQDLILYSFDVETAYL